jgi:tetratricopeptide (TPR) repeat protein
MRNFLLCTLAFWAACAGVASAQDAASEQQRLYDQMMQQPANYQVTVDYVKVAVQRGDYEAAIGALERLLFYNPNLPLVKFELGVLYYRLRAFDIAKRYFTEAQANPDLNAATKAKIEVYLADADTQSLRSRLSGFLQTGLRYQSNASFSPDGGVTRFNGQTFNLPPTSGGNSDANWFGLVGLSHDYDLQDGPGDVLETRVFGSLTQQFRFNNLNVGLVEASVGPRLSLPSGLLSDATIKPYVAGGNVWVGGSQFLSSKGAGVSLRIGAPWGGVIEPSFEYRRVEFASSTPTLAEFDTGNWFTAGLSSGYAITDQLRLDGRVYYRRGQATTDFQSFGQWLVEAAASYEFAPPFSSIPRSWAVTTFGRLIKTDFDAANPFIDPRAGHADFEWVVGVTFNMPITRTFGISTTVQYDQVSSSLPNYGFSNLSILSGPTARF